MLWLRAGGTRASVRLGVELLAAIRERRLDLRIALTFEEDYADLLEERVRGLQKIGLGYGPADTPRAARRAVGRLGPFALVLVDTPPDGHVLREAAALGSHLVAFNTPPTPVPVEAAYPVDEAQARAWHHQGVADYVAPAADPLSLFAEAAADTTLRSLVAGERDLQLWWWHGPSRSLPALLSAWRSHPLAADGVLCASLTDPEPAPIAARLGHDLAVSTWRREALAAGTVLLVDDARWLAAAVSASTAGHLEDTGRDAFWQALAGGSALSVDPRVAQRYPSVAGIAPERSGVGEVLALWQQLREAPLEARRIGDACRRRFWQERRRVGQVRDEFLQRVFDW